MLFLNPSEATLFGSALRNVRAVAIEREATRLATEQSDLGPHVVFADAPEQRVTIRLSRTLAGDAGAPPRPGDSGELSFRAGAGADDAGVRRYSAGVVVTRVRYDLNAKGGAREEIEAIAVSDTGAADPIVESEVAL